MGWVFTKKGHFYTNGFLPIEEELKMFENNPFVRQGTTNSEDRVYNDGVLSPNGYTLSNSNILNTENNIPIVAPTPITSSPLSFNLGGLDFDKIIGLGVGLLFLSSVFKIFSRGD
jgi:hypothetical protein